MLAGIDAMQFAIDDAGRPDTRLDVAALCEIHRVLMADMVAACADETLPPLVHAALVHAQFEAIHPFNDGNGRVGRALVHLLLRRRGARRRDTPQRISS